MDTFKDFFSQIPDILKYGLLGLSVIMLFVLAYVAIKQPNNKFSIIIITVFCAFVLIFFSVSGIGLQKENDQVKTANSNLVSTKDSLVQKNDSLYKDNKIANTKIFTTKIINDLSNPALPRDTLANKFNKLASQFTVLKNESSKTDTLQIGNISRNYKFLALKLQNGKNFSAMDKQNLYNTNNAAKNIILNK